MRLPRAPLVLGFRTPGCCTARHLLGCMYHWRLPTLRNARLQPAPARTRPVGRQLRTERTGAAARGATHIVQKRLRETTFGAS